MEALRDYCQEEQMIDGLKTYIIAPERYLDLLGDEDLLYRLGIFGPAGSALATMIQNTVEKDEMQVGVAIVRHDDRKLFVWEPVNICCKDGRYYHVSVVENWFCLKCRHVNAGRFLLPMAEADQVFLDRGNRYDVPIPVVFERIPCEACGELLSRHLMRI